MESSDPANKYVKHILNDEVLAKEFDLDKRKFSRNYEGSFYLDKLNTGAKVSILTQTFFANSVFLVIMHAFLSFHGLIGIRVTTLHSIHSWGDIVFLSKHCFNFIMEANTMNPDQSLIWVHIVRNINHQISIESA